MATHSGFEQMAWSDLAVVLAIGRAGSLAGAARDLGCTHSTVYRRITALEKSVGVRFFERMPTGYVPTEAGDIALRYAERVESEFHALHREVLGRDAELRGEVRLTAPEGIISQILPLPLAEFRRQHPRVTLELLQGNAAFDLRRREADLAIRATPRPPDDALGRRVCGFRFAFYASADYLERAGERPLCEYDFIELERIIEWFVPRIWRTREQAEERVVLRTNAVHAAVNAARAGMGVLPMSCYRVDPIEDLVRIGPPADFLDMELWVLTHPALRHTARVKELMSFLVEALKEHAPLFEGRTRD